MREIGIDLSGRRPRKLTVEMQLHADWAVTMGCGDVCPYVPTTVEDWDIPDPAGRPIEEVREIRDDDRRARRATDRTIASTRSSATARRTSFDSSACCRRLIAEFEAVRSPEEIRACADAILDATTTCPSAPTS